MSGWWSLHNHSRYSVTDAMPAPKDMVAKAVELGWPAQGLCDHGTLAGVVQHYKACRAAGIECFPGEEFYFIGDREWKAKENRRHMHLTIAAASEEGYRNLVDLNTLAHRNFHYKPRVDLADLAAYAAAGKTHGLVLATGCRSGPVIRALQAAGEAAAEQVVKTLAGWFPLTYVELMNHDLDADGMHDEEITAALVRIADRVGVPYLISSDSHYCEPGHRRLHDTFKQLFSWKETDEDMVFGGSTGYHLPAVEELADHFEPEVFARAVANAADLAARCKVRIAELETFTLAVPDVTHTGDPQYELEQRCWEALSERGLEDEAHIRRLNAELPVIEASQMPGYLLLVAEVCAEAKRRGIWYGARGSASGSLACYLLAITQDDPVTHGIRMDRFLSGDRTKPPDIDIDFEHERRKEMIAWLHATYPCAKVSTYSDLGLDADRDGTDKGSLLVKYHSRRNRLIDAEYKPRVDAVMEELKEAVRVVDGIRGEAGDREIDRRWRAHPLHKEIVAAKKSPVPAEDLAELKELAGMDLVGATGVHAAGSLIAPDAASLARVPMSYIAGTSKTMVTAYDKDDVEAVGFPKLDLLGLRTLTAMRIACELIEPGAPKGYWDAIPTNDKTTYTAIRQGKVDGVFQLEGYTAKNGARKVKPTKLEDVIVCMALFRTGMSKASVDAFIRLKESKAVEAAGLHADIMAEAAITYGILVYQEQAIGVLRTLGMEPEELTALLNAVKASGKKSLTKGKEVVESYLPRIRELAAARGWAEQDITWISSGLLGYGAGYTFNRGHAVAYGVIAYKTAYIAVHHPLAYWTGMLIAYTGEDAEPKYLAAAASAGIAILPPHVNTSAVTYSADLEHNAIHIGLTGIKNVGRAAAEELVANAKYTSLRDLGERVVARRVGGAKKLALGTPPLECGGVIEALGKAGALSGLE